MVTPGNGRRRGRWEEVQRAASAGAGCAPEDSKAAIIQGPLDSCYLLTYSVQLTKSLWSPTDRGSTDALLICNQMSADVLGVLVRYPRSQTTFTVLVGLTGIADVDDQRNAHQYRVGKCWTRQVTNGQDGDRPDVLEW